MAKRRFEVVLAGDARSLSRAFGQAGSDAETMGSRISSAARTGAIALAGIAAAGIAFLAPAVSSASDLNETISKSNTIFGDNAAEIESWGDRAAESIGQSKQQALDAAGTFGNLFSQLGIGSEKTADMSTQMVELASDFASFHNADITEVLEAQTAAFRGEYDAVQRYVPTINAAAVEQKAMEMGLARTTKELDAQDKALATQALLVEGAGAAMGDFDRTSDGLANKQRILSAQWSDMQARIGGALIPVVSAAVGWFSDKMLPAIEGVADEILTNVPGMIATVAGFVEGPLDALGTWWDENGPAILSFVAELAGDVRDWIDDVSPAVQSWVEDVLGELSAWWEQWGPGIVELVEGIGDAVVTMGEGVVEAVQTVHRNWDNLRVPLMAIAGIITAVMIPHWIALGTASLVNSAKSAAAWVTTQTGAITAAISHSAAIAGMVAGWVLLGVQSLINAAKMAAAWLIALGPIGLVIAAVLGLVALIIANWDTVVAVTTTAFDAVWGAINSVFDWVQRNWPTILAILTGPIGLAVLAITTHWDTIKGGVTGVKDWIVARFDEIVGFFTGMPDRISTAASGMWDGIKDAFRSAINWIIDKWNGLEFSIGEFDPPGPGSFGGVTIGTPHIPRLAQGALVVDPMVALIGEDPRTTPEIVSPVETMRAVVRDELAAAGGGQGGMNFYGPVSMGKGTEEDLDWYARTKGTGI